MSRNRAGLLYRIWVNRKLPLLIVAGLNLILNVDSNCIKRILGNMQPNILETII